MYAGCREAGKAPSRAGACRVCLKALKPGEVFHTCSGCQHRVCEDCSSYSKPADNEDAVGYYNKILLVQVSSSQTEVLSPGAASRDGSLTTRPSGRQERSLSPPLSTRLASVAFSVVLSLTAVVHVSIALKLILHLKKWHCSVCRRKAAPRLPPSAQDSTDSLLDVPMLDALQRRHSEARLGGGASSTALAPPRSPELRRHSDVSPASLKELEKLKGGGTATPATESRRPSTVTPARRRSVRAPTARQRSVDDDKQDSPAHAPSLGAPPPMSRRLGGLTICERLLVENPYVEPRTVAMAHIGGGHVQQWTAIG
ncbi:hypothetical protein MSG28_005193 [Choristoneura fumiferana]|uniref:Uncharacterized protein n=1 Tax=Choristoneura fumiferana TaxID=7141 RepID=A0ACC0JQH3_CHOFU|nr:hypothetical protein MSG28_005193 [Choristoneura fumiferana]